MLKQNLNKLNNSLLKQLVTLFSCQNIDFGSSSLRKWGLSFCTLSIFVKVGYRTEHLWDEVVVEMNVLYFKLVYFCFDKVNNQTLLNSHHIFVPFYLLTIDKDRLWTRADAHDWTYWLLHIVVNIFAEFFVIIFQRIRLSLNAFDHHLRNIFVKWGIFALLPPVILKWFLMVLCK